ncbi:MAG: outer membrane protein [Francisellaceae bacterium]|jgi:outer membrane protein
MYLKIKDLLKLFFITFIIYIMFCSFLFAKKVNLLEMYRIASQDSPILKSANSFYQSERTKIPQARALFLPNLSFIGELGTKGTYEESNYKGLTNQYSLGITLSQTIFDYSAYHFNDVIKNQVNSAYQMLTYQKQLFMMMVAKSYLTVILSEANIKVSEEQINATEAALTQAKEQQRLGQKNISELQQIQSVLYSSKAELIKAINSYETSKYNLTALTGIQDMDLMPTKGNIPIFGPIPKHIDKWVNMALRNNKKLASFRYKLKTYRSRVDVCKGNFYPKINLSASYFQLLSPTYEPGFGQGFFNQKIPSTKLNKLDSSSTCMSYASNQLMPSKYSRGWSQLKGQRINSGMINLNFTWNIFNGGTDYYKVKQATENYQKSSYETLQMERDIKLMTEQNYLNVINSIGKIKALKQAKIASDIAYKMLSEKHRLGATPINQVLQQMQITFQNAYNLTESKFIYIGNILQLKLDAGILSLDDIIEINYWLQN